MILSCSTPQLRLQACHSVPPQGLWYLLARRYGLLPCHTVDGLWGQKASGSGLETTSGVPSKNLFLLETELCGSLEVGPGCCWASSLSLGLFSTHTCLRQRLWGVTLGTGQEVVRESRGLAFRMGARCGGHRCPLGLILCLSPCLSLHFSAPPSICHPVPPWGLALLALHSALPSGVHLVPPRAHGGDLGLGGGTARRQAGEGWKAGLGQREGPRAGSRGNRSPGRPQGPGWDRREVGAQFHRAVLREEGRRCGQPREEDAGTRVLASRGGPRGGARG